MPTPTTKKRQELRSRFVTNAIPQEGDYADLIAAGLNQADDGLLKLPDQPLALVAPKQPEKPNDAIGVLNFFVDPAATDPSWQLQLKGSGTPGIGLADQTKTTRLFLDGTTGNLGVGTAKPTHRLTVEGPWNASKDPANNLSNDGQLAIKGSRAQLDFIDSDPNQADWAIHVNDGKLSFIRSPWEDKNLVLDGAGNVGVGTDTPTAKLDVAGDLRATGIIRASGYRFSVQGFEFELKDGLLTPIATPQFTRSARENKKVDDIDFRRIISYNAVDNDKADSALHKHHIWTIPAGVEWIFIKLWGAGGGAGRAGCWHQGADGGGGGHTRGLFKVVPNEQLIVVVGRGGTTANGTRRPYGGGGTNNGALRGEGDNFGGHGGGYCGVFRTSISRANALAIAGGGGGGGASRDWVGNIGGAGGGLSGQRGASPFDLKFTAGGGGGTQKEGGKGGHLTLSNTGPGFNGSELLGGVSADVSNGGAGGGGYFGGGGGAYHEPRTMGGGGGGSGYTNPEGLVTGTYTGHFRVPPYSWDPDLLSDLAEAEALGFGGQNRGGVIWSGAQSGGHARAVIYY